MIPLAFGCIIGDICALVDWRGVPEWATRFLYEGRFW
jgi:hypothetical protein